MDIFRKYFSVCFLLCLSGLGNVAWAAPVKIGWASRDVTPAKPDLIVGASFQRVSKGVHDPLTLTALALEHGGDAVVFISGDAL
ncbi:MAG: hypothetical protein PHV59_07945, partial [Victivallales bacterium]|nr:hypothetical protein [Victivallales bacterium]